MDCRKTLVLALCLLAGTTGCVTTGTQTPPTGPTPPPTDAGAAPSKVEKTAEAQQPKRKPKAATCVAFGDFRLHEALDPHTKPAERDHSLDQARKAYQQALEIDPNYKPAYAALARYYLEVEDPERALATFQKALQRFPKDASFWFDLGMAYARNKNWNPALENMGKALELEPENREYLKAMGFCLARAGRDQDSLACLSKVMRPAEAHYYIARMHQHLKQDELSKQHLILAVQADPNFTPAQELLVRLQEGPPATPAQVGTVSFESEGSSEPAEPR
jgi:tetratricopeptide (TPR) repeat protein